MVQCGNFSVGVHRTAVVPAPRTLLMFLLLLLMLAGTAAAEPLRCAEEAAQLFPVNVELLDAAGSVLYASAAPGGRPGCRKLCSHYPRALEDWSDKQLLTAWRGFTNLATVQFVLPMVRGAAAVLRTELCHRTAIHCALLLHQ